MGDTDLDRGLIPITEVEGAFPPDIQLQWMWILVALHAHRFRGRPIAEVLASWTNILLLHRGLHPTIGDIAQASGLPRATVSRYVASTIEQGWATERVDPRNRLRRELYLTDKGREELRWMVDFFHDAYRQLKVPPVDAGEHEADTDYLAHLQSLTDLIRKHMERAPVESDSASG